jgi:UDP-N-acetylglucosamine transferase subunit ALG13
LTPTGAGNRLERRVVVTVGTDHHPFDRLVTWVNDWLARHPDETAAFFVQSGSASATPLCRSSRFLGPEQLETLLDEASVLICHGGPGSIADAWARGQVPIVVPRLRRFGEAVDDHQVDFCRKLNGLGRVLVAETPSALDGLLDEASRDVRRFRTSGVTPDVEAAVARFAALVDELVSRPRRPRPLFDKPWRARHSGRIRSATPKPVEHALARPRAMDRTKWQADSLSTHAGEAAGARMEKQ